MNARYEYKSLKTNNILLVVKKRSIKKIVLRKADLARLFKDYQQTYPQ